MLRGRFAGAGCRQSLARQLSSSGKRAHGGGDFLRSTVQAGLSFFKRLVKFIGTHAEYDRINPNVAACRRMAMTAADFAAARSGLPARRLDCARETRRFSP
jgi:hypothetical protein